MNEVVRMNSAMVLRRPVPEWATRPPYWLVSALDSAPGDGRALVMCPDLARKALMGWVPSVNLVKFLDVCDLYQGQAGYRVVFISDVAYWLEFEQDQTWSVLGINPDAAVAELESCSPWNEVRLSDAGYWHLADADGLITGLDGEGELYVLLREDRAHGRAMTRLSLAATIEQHWPGLIEELVMRGELILP